MSSIASIISEGGAGNKPIVLLVGNSMESVKTIATTLESCYFEQCQPISASDIMNKYAACSGICLHKTFDAKIVTKYYSASVIVQALVVEPSMALEVDMLESCEAVVGVPLQKTLLIWSTQKN